MIRTAITMALALSLTSCAKEKNSAPAQAESASKVTTSQTSAAAEMLSLDDLLHKHFAALGGEQKLRTAKTLHYAGKKQHDGKTVTVSKYLKRGGKLRVEKREGDNLYVMAINGDKGWKQKNGEVAALPPEKLAHMEHEASIDDALLIYKDKGYRVELLGKTEIKGRPAYKLALHIGDMAEKRFIDAASFFEVKRVIAWKDKEEKMHKTAVYFSDYRDVGDGMMINHRVDWKSEKGEGSFIIDKAVYNQPIDDDKFDLGKKNVM